MKKQNEGRGVTQRRYEELRLLYQVSVSDIAAFKQQQWNTTNYALLLYAAIVSVPKLLPESICLSKNENLILIAVAFSILGAGWRLLSVYSQSIRERWYRLTEIRKYFTREFKTAWRGGKSEMEKPDDPEQKKSLLWFFRSVLVIGFLVVLGIMLKYANAT